MLDQAPHAPNTRELPLRPNGAAECTDAPRKVCELALSHVNTNRIEAAYRRTDLFERRRALMEQWAAFLAQSAVQEPI